jgi:hypothetical protein
MPCGDSGWPLYQISFVASATSKKCRDVGLQRDVSYLLLERCFSIESGHAVFPQMHQKAELTCVQFNRTFTFVLTAEIGLSQTHIRFEDNYQQNISAP